MKRLKSLQSPAVPPEVGDDEKEVWVSYNWLPLSACDSSYLGTDRLAFDSWALITESGLGAWSIEKPGSCQSYKRGSPAHTSLELTIIQRKAGDAQMRSGQDWFCLVLPGLVVAAGTI